MQKRLGYRFQGKLDLQLGIEPRPQGVVLPFYSNKVFNTQNANLIAYWRLNEDSGTIIDNIEGTAARDGTLDGATLGVAGIGDGLTACSFDGSNDSIDVYSASLNSVLDGEVGSLMAWALCDDWAQASFRRFVNIQADGGNQLRFTKNVGNMNWNYTAGGINEQQITAQAGIDFHQFVMTWDLNAGVDGEVIYYQDGAQSGPTDTALGTWVGALAVNDCAIGAVNNSGGGSWNGDAAHVALWAGIALTPAEVADLFIFIP